jgi:hypothetical protein
MDLRQAGIRPERQETKGAMMLWPADRWQGNDPATEQAGAKPVKATAIDAADGRRSRNDMVLYCLPTDGPSVLLISRA